MICRCNRENRSECGCLLNPCVFSNDELMDAMSRSTICPIGCDDGGFIESDESNEFLLLIAGTRTFTDFNLFEAKVNLALSKKNPDNVVIISGGARGADSLAKKYAQKHHISFIEFPADWSAGKKAGYDRNHAMHEYLASVPIENRGCLLFWDGKSKGTKQNYELAEKFGTVVKTVKIQ